MSIASQKQIIFINMSLVQEQAHEQQVLWNQGPSVEKDFC